MIRIADDASVGTLHTEALVFQDGSEQSSAAKAPVYFSVQLVTNATGAAGIVPLTGALWNSGTIVTSHNQPDFTTSGFIVPRPGVFKIDCYQTITSTGLNSATATLTVKNGNTTLAQSREGEVNPLNTNYTSNPIRSESVAWVGTLSVADVITFEIQCDGGFTNSESHGIGCYTIVSVD